ncbi:hypothetical protein [Capnocytophaga canimorsus]|uniref:hypothetical protein n=1 Tax=Capnocytophaga canimorsus TaxID=28188 RepID=UPI0037D760C7
MMNKKLKIQHLLKLFVALAMYSCSNGQTPTAYHIGKIPQLERFETLTKNEIRLDSLKDKHQKEELQMMLDGKAFIEGTPQEFVQKMIEKHKITALRYKDNRSRYFIKTLAKSKEYPFLSTEEEPFTTDCTCVLDNDTIKIRMGIWVFGGFQFNINLSKNDFQTLYWEDTHERNTYKQSLSDTLTDNITLEMQQQKLILAKKPTFTLGEELLGHLTFKTNEFYQQTEEIDAENSQDMLKVAKAGELYFRCQVRQKTEDDK